MTSLRFCGRIRLNEKTEQKIFMNEALVSSWPDLMEQLFVDSWNPEIMRHRSPYAFRGLSNKDYELSTRLMRLGGNYAGVERHLLRNFRKYALDDVPKGKDSFWKWLAVAQHFGLPTRLLDWTFSPFVAAHFATCDLERYDVDGAIWCVNFIETNKLLPKKLQHLLDIDGALNLTIEMLDHAVASLPEFDSLALDSFAVFLDPPSLDGRIVNQYALFSMMSNPLALLNDWLESRPKLFRKIVIPARLKWEIRDKLDKANITERTLFPGLDGLAGWLARYYTPRQAYDS